MADKHLNTQLLFETFFNKRSLYDDIIYVMNKWFYLMKVYLQTCNA